MDDKSFLTEQFEVNRPHLRAVAYRILGNAHDVDDALQDAWLRVSNAGDDEISNVTGWLTTIVARICLNTLRQRQRRPIDSFSERLNYEPLIASTATTPEEQALLADSIGVALLVVLELLSPAERISFVLHDLFSLSFDEVGEILGKSSEASRQLASRARRRIHASNAPSADPQLQREVVDAFLIGFSPGASLQSGGENEQGHKRFDRARVPREGTHGSVSGKARQLTIGPAGVEFSMPAWSAG